MALTKDDINLIQGAIKPQFDKLRSELATDLDNVVEALEKRFDKIESEVSTLKKTTDATRLDVHELRLNDTILSEDFKEIRKEFKEMKHSQSQIESATLQLNDDYAGIRIDLNRLQNVLIPTLDEHSSQIQLINAKLKLT